MAGTSNANYIVDLLTIQIESIYEMWVKVE